MGLMRAIINIKKSRFEILNIVYLENAWCSCIMDPLVLELAQKAVKSVDNITTRLCETLQPDGLCLTASRDR